MAKRLTIMGLLLILVIGGLVGFNLFRQKMIAEFLAGNKPPPVPVETEIADLGAVPQTLTGIGSLVAARQVTIQPEVSGRIIKLFFESGNKIEADAPLLQMNDEPERADLASARAQASLAKVTLERASKLAQPGFTTQQTLDQARSELSQAEAQAARAQAIINQKLVRAPFTGVLGIRNVNLGQYLSPGDQIVTLTDLSQLYVNFTLPEQDRPVLVIGQKVQVTVDALPGRTFEAVLTAIEPRISPDTRTISLQATMDNPGQVLKPGMFIRAAVALPELPNQVTVAATALVNTLYGDSVFVVRPGEKDAQGKPVFTVSREPVKAGARFGNRVAITEGLKGGEQVIVSGQNKLMQGAAVIPQQGTILTPPATPPRQ